MTYPYSIRMSSGFPFVTAVSFVLSFICSSLLVEWVGFRSSQTKLYPHLGAAAYFLNLNVRKISYVILLKVPDRKHKPKIYNEGERAIKS